MKNNRLKGLAPFTLCHGLQDVHPKVSGRLEAHFVPQYRYSPVMGPRIVTGPAFDVLHLEYSVRYVNPIPQYRYFFTLHRMQDLYCTVLYYIVLYCTILYCTVLYCIILYCTALYCTLLYCTLLYLLYCTVLTVLYCAVVYCTVLTVLYCTVLYSIVLYCTVLYCTVLCLWLYRKHNKAVLP